MASSKPKEVSVVMDMVPTEDESDYDDNFTADEKLNDESQREQSTDTSYSFEDEAGKHVSENVASYVWETGSRHVKRAWSVYTNIDILRPYFDVEPQQVRMRIVQSFIPRKLSGERQKIHRELYGPTMAVFTLIALLLFQMKNSGHYVQEGTLMGTAFFVCFGYWLGVSSFVWVVAYLCNVRITILQILSLLGYALFGHCVVVFLSFVIHSGHDHIFFYLTWAIIGGLTTLRLISVLISRAPSGRGRIVLCSLVAAFHLLFLIYLHFAYHRIVEDLSAAIQEKPIVYRPPIKDIEKGHVIKDQGLDGQHGYETTNPAGLLITPPKPLLDSEHLPSAPASGNLAQAIIRNAGKRFQRHGSLALASSVPSISGANAADVNAASALKKNMTTGLGSKDSFKIADKSLTASSNGTELLRVKRKKLGQTGFV